MSYQVSTTSSLSLPLSLGGQNIAVQDSRAEKVNHWDPLLKVSTLNCVGWDLKKVYTITL
eukprot:scaffold12807_cov156-Skeletonema_menzelii.AAC.1